MSQKLTAQRAALYYGCEFSYKANRPCKMEGIYPQRLTNDGITYPVADCRLSLVPLEKITREHAIMWYRVEFPQHEGMEDEEMVLHVANWIGMKLQMSQRGADLLRSLGYDCDNAIQDGWAVDKTTLI